LGLRAFQDCASIFKKLGTVPSCKEGVKMSKIAAEIKNQMREKETDELLKIWEENNRDEWSDEAFKALSDILTERGISLPAQLKKGNDQKSCKNASTLRSTSLKILGTWFIASILIGFIRPNLPDPFQIGPISLNLLVLTDLLLTVLLFSGIICLIVSFFNKGKKKRQVMFKQDLCNSTFSKYVALLLFCSILFSGSYFGNIALAEGDEIPIKGVLFNIGGDEKIKSPWGELDSQMLLLNDHQQISMSGNNMKIIFGLIYWSSTSGMQLDPVIKFSGLYEAKSPISVKLFREEGSGKWCATDGILGISNSNPIVFEGLTITVIGGADDPIRVAGVLLSDTTVIIKDGKPVKID